MKPVPFSDIDVIPLSPPTGQIFSLKPSWTKKTPMTLIEMVKDKTVSFKYYRDGELWYETQDGFLFPVPITDIGTATFLATDKAILFMRYIRKWMEKMKHAEDE